MFHHRKQLSYINYLHLVIILQVLHTWKEYKCMIHHSTYLYSLQTQILRKKKVFKKKRFSTMSRMDLNDNESCTLLILKKINLCMNGMECNAMDDYFFLKESL